MPKSLLNTALIVALIFLLAAMCGFLDSNDEKAQSAATKCGVAMGVNMMKDAESYCRSALEIVTADQAIKPLTAVRVHMQMGTFFVVAGKPQEAALQCQHAIGAWSRVPPDQLPDQRESDIKACNDLIAAAKIQSGK